MKVAMMGSRCSGISNYQDLDRVRVALNEKTTISCAVQNSSAWPEQCLLNISDDNEPHQNLKCLSEIVFKKFYLFELVHINISVHIILNYNHLDFKTIDS